MKLIYHLTDAARKRLFVETGRDPGQVQSLEIDPAQLSRDDRAFLAECGFALGDKASLSYSDVGPTAAWGSVPTHLVQDAIATDAGELLAAYREARAAGAARLAESNEAQIAKEIEQFRWQEWIDAHAAAVAAAKALQATIAEQRRQDAERQEAEKARRIEERRAWAMAHGSSRLRKCVEGGYDCQRLYVFERAALEHPGYVVDFDDKAEWKARSGPSEAALDEAAGVGGEVVWLTARPIVDEYDNEPPREAVVIRQYLGRYDLVKVM